MCRNYSKLVKSLILQFLTVRSLDLPASASPRCSRIGLTGGTLRPPTNEKEIHYMKRLFLTLMIAGALLIPSTALAQSAPTMQRLEGIWIFRALFGGESQPVYVGTAQFQADGKFAGPPNDQTTGPAVG